MAKSERGEKSKAIRDYVSAHPNAGPKEIIEALKSQGTTVTASLVSAVKYKKGGISAKRGGGRGRKGRGQVSELIRAYLTEHPGAKPKEIQEALAGQGVKASAGLISNVKFHFGRQGAKRGRPAGRAAGRPSAGGVTIEQLIQVKDLAGSLGGLDQLRKAADMLAQLQ